MTKAIDLYIHKLDSGEEVPPVTLEEPVARSGIHPVAGAQRTQDEAGSRQGPGAQGSRHDEKERFRRAQKRNGRSGGK